MVEDAADDAALGHESHGCLLKPAGDLVTRFAVELARQGPACYTKIPVE